MHRFLNFQAETMYASPSEDSVLMLSLLSTRNLKKKRVLFHPLPIVILFV
jgi:hypothetical protein